MPNFRLPKVKLSFLKKLLPKRSEPEVAPERVANINVNKQEVEREKAALEELALEECPICHDPVGIRNPEGVLESWVHLHCNHKFGTHCIQTWLQESAERDPYSIPSCPICRTTAKHPCGHLVIMPAQRPHPFAMWMVTPPSPHHPHSTGARSRRPRRRLTRRIGHPLRPLQPQPERAHVQIVGECAICAATAAAQEKMKETAAPNVETGNTTDSERDRSSDRRNGIKSMLFQASARRLSWSTRNDNSPPTIDTPSERITPILPTRTSTPPHYMNLCQPEITVAGSPATAPLAHRALASC